ncbi:MAG: hypothetical protein KatS3mg018_0941 [Fimbriimonadales bacterium]|nr:MAG: hypothetical protein KatS3mg018_0941 [Fimbriimonadales bacterium]
MQVQIYSPQTGNTCEGRLARVDSERQSFVVHVENAALIGRSGGLVQATLCVGGAPRQLTAQAAIIDPTSVLLTPITPARHAERRTRKRYSIRAEAQLQLGDATLTVSVVNISVSGVGILAPVSIEIGTRGRLQMNLVGLGEPLISTIEARHCRPNGDAQFYIGAVFVELNRSDALWLRKLFP